MALDATEFRRLIEQHQTMVFSLALRVTGERGAAEEVAQDVFLELFRAGERLASEDHARFWLRRVTVHRATDALRKRSARPDMTADEFVEDGTASDSFQNHAPPDYALEARLEELLQSLPEHLRVAIVLRYQEDMLPEEIAALLNQPLATVKSHLQRGLQMLRRKAAVTMRGYVRGH
jgi:RNA polymerase sigma-70 factor (ECF subfamily)